MLRANASITQRHPWETVWYEWMLNLRGLLYYSYDQRHTYTTGMYLIGALLSTAAAAITAGSATLLRSAGRRRTRTNALASLSCLALASPSSPAGHPLIIWGVFACMVWGFVSCFLYLRAKHGGGIKNVTSLQPFFTRIAYCLAAYWWCVTRGQARIAKGAR